MEKVKLAEEYLKDYLDEFKKNWNGDGDVTVVVDVLPLAMADKAGEHREGGD